MKPLIGIVLSLGLVFGVAAKPEPFDLQVLSARAVLDDYMAAFNARDEEAWAAMLHYPHVRIASGKVLIAIIQRIYRSIRF